MEGAVMVFPGSLSSCSDLTELLSGQAEIFHELGHRRRFHDVLMDNRF